MPRLYNRRMIASSATLAWVFGFAAPSAGCASGYDACKRDPVTGSEQCQASSGDYREAAGTAAAAGTAWGIAGCTINGCELPFHCNASTKMCERIRCGEGHGSCPPSYNCDPDDHRCR